MQARKVETIRDAPVLGWSPDGRPRRAIPPRRAAAEILLRSSLYVVPRPDQLEVPELSVEAQHRRDRISFAVVIWVAAVLWCLAI
jgi:hypothetical protein